MALTNEQLVHQMYIAYYQRPADPDGLAYWVDQIATNGSWEVVAGAFGAPENAEYQALYGDKTRAELIAELYQSAFGRVAVQEEIEFWVASEHSDQNLGFAIVSGAQNDDLATVNNKVKFAELLVAEVGTNDAYIALGENAKSLMSAVTKDSEVTAESVAEAVAGAGEASTLVKALQDLDAAQTALVDFLASADGDEDPLTSTDGPTIKTAYENAVVVTDGLVGGNYTDASAAVKAQLLSAQETANAEALTAADSKVAGAKAKIAKVAGLTEAVAAAKAAELALATATQAAAAAQVAENAASAAWVITANGDAKIDGAASTGGVLTVTVDDATASVFPDNTVLTLTKVSATGVVSLAEAEAGWNANQVAFFEAQQALAADLITKFNASVSAEAAAVTAYNGKTAADLAAALLDKGADAATTAALASVGAAISKTEVADAAKPTAAEIAAEIAALTKIENDGQSVLASSIGLAADQAVLETAVDAAVTDGFIDAASAALIKSAFATGLADEGLAAAKKAAIDVLADATNTTGDLATFNLVVQAYYAAELADNPLQEALAPLEAAVVTAQAAIDALAAAVADEQAKGELLNEFNQLDADLKAAQKVLADAEYEVSTITATQTATAENDVYLVGSVDGIINGFGAAGSDSIFLGTDYVLNTGKVGTDGNNSVLEIFLTQDVGGNTTVTIETSVFGSNAATPEVIEVILAGVAADELILVDGMLSVA